MSTNSWNWNLTIQKMIWLVKHKNNIKKFVDVTIEKNLNNETIGESAEASICLVTNIVCHINNNRINPIIVNRLIKKLKETNILDQLPSKIISSDGYKNGSIDFKLENGDTVSLKTLKYKDGKVCPQKLGQPTLKSWDKLWNQSWNGQLEKNSERWDFIKMNIHQYLNKMLQEVFCCDHLIIISDCIKNPKVTLYKTESLKDTINYFTNQDIIYSRENYEERWNEQKQKYSEMSSTIKLNINEKEIKIGEFQFHKSSRQVLKFRFWDGFLQLLF